ncbi:F-box/kelch-repeat protein At1g22040 [Vicia villosa]|uniref:F-box/kelch-repeat protein At1g22040 n=1 Tax=Vicia villosa TaxID=3911 RepID=UPI00273A8996|nr:F-box/kelch-repeat protein At1g22040 [Vicia villosa]XP_058787680.1 F-box/kelch-repeat protein At1g22040 [Vicia villosa]XP_058787681.1 F-box/kelch-repeat protein At1g22040 [Vicia villosa]
MGSVFSVARASNNDSDKREWDGDGVSANDTCKRQRMSLPTVDEENPRLFPNLPDEVSIQIIARVPRICYFSVRLVSRKWKSTIMSSELYKIRKELGSTEEWLYMLVKVGENKLLWHAVDPRSRIWQRLPTMPSVVDEEESRKGSSSRLWMWNMVEGMRIAEVIRGFFGQKDSFDEMPFCGCAIGAVGGCLYVLGGFSKASTMRCVWRFDPIQNTWSEVTSMSTGRAYCKTGILNNKLYVVGGVSQGSAGLLPLQSAEVFDPSTGTWSDVPSMPFSRAQVLPNAFLADMLKPIATGLTPYMGRLCVPQSLYSWPFFVDVGGEIYDPETNSWIEMPTGMGEGWPARQAGTKLSVVVDGELYAFDPSNTMDSGRIKVYDQREDAWKVVIGKVPIYGSDDSESPYLLAGFHGKLHVITKDANHNISVLQAELRNNLHSSPSSPSSSLSQSSVHEFVDPPVETDAVIWKMIASRCLGQAELVSCQVIDM